MGTLNKDLKVRLSVLTEAEGGAAAAINQGCRPFLRYHGKNWIVVLHFFGRQMAYPGETVNAYVTFLTPIKQLGRISEGLEFELCLGPKIMAKGVVTKVIDLWRSASDSKEH